MVVPGVWEDDFGKPCIGEEISTHITQSLLIGAPVYVDDILGIGDCKTVEKVIRNTRRLEEAKKFRFSRKKNQKIWL